MSRSLLSFVLLALALAGGVFYLQPLWQEVSSLDAAYASSVSEHDRLTQTLENLNQLESQAQNTSEVRSETSLAAVPEKFEQDEIFRTIKRIAQKNDVLVSGINFSVPANTVEGQLAKSTINLTLSANQNALEDFLKDIETDSRKMLVKSIAVQVSDRDELLSRINFTVTIETYYQGLI